MFACWRAFASAFPKRERACRLVNELTHVQAGNGWPSAVMRASQAQFGQFGYNGSRLWLHLEFSQKTP